MKSAALVKFSEVPALGSSSSLSLRFLVLVWPTNMHRLVSVGREGRSKNPSFLPSRPRLSHRFPRFCVLVLGPLLLVVLALGLLRVLLLPCAFL